MKNKKIPLRTCIVTKEVLPKQELFRIVINKEKEVSIDLTGKQNGRGVYLKKDISVINKAKDLKLLDKKLEVKIEEKLYEDLINLMK
ncbi:MAG: YlxR family protein [Clostridiales bacterium]|jgi:Predicted nucleic-acid-binding protein implicated in transcription termination|nr:YlxR family protein [Clostridiales bacterium]